MATPEIKVKISAESEALFSGLNQVTQAVQKSAEQISSSMGSGFGKLTSIFESLKGTILGVSAILAGGKLFGDSISETVSFTREMEKLTRVLGSNAKESATLSVAIGDIYGDVDAFLAGAGKLTKTLNTNEEAIKNLGVQTRKANGEFKDAPTLIAEINKKLGEFKEGTDRDIEAQKVYGRSYQEMLRYIDLTPEVLDAAKKKVEELGLSFDANGEEKIAAYRAIMNDVGDTLLALKVRIGQELMPSLTTLGEWFVSVGPSLINNTISALKLLTELLNNTVVQVTLLAGSLYLLGQLATIQTLLTAVSVALKGFAVNAMIATSSTAGLGIAFQALGASMLSLLTNPLVLIAALIASLIALTMAAQSYSKEAAEAAEKTRALAAEGVGAAKEFGGLSEQVDKLENKLNTTAVGSKIYNDTKKQLNQTVERSLELYPDLISYLQKENGAYVNVSESMEKFRKAKLKKLDSDIEESRRKATEARNENVEAMQGGWSGIVGYAIVYKGIADNALKEAQAHEATTKELIKQKAVLLGQEEDKKSSLGGTGDGETALAKIRANLEKAKYEYEKAAYDKGQLLEFSKNQEVAFLEDSLNHFSGTVKERKELELMLFNAKRQVMVQSHQLEMDALKSELVEYQHNADKRLEIVNELLAKSKNDKEKQDALSLIKKTNVDIKIDQDKANAELEKSKTDHNLAMLNNDLTYYNMLKSEGLLSNLDFLILQDDIEEKKYQIALKGFQDRLALLVQEGNTEKEAQEKINSQILALKDKRNTEHGANVASQGMETGTVGDGIGDGLQKSIASALPTAKLVSNAVTGVFTSLQSSMANAFTGILTGQMKLGAGLKAIWNGLGSSVAAELGKMAAAKIALWLVEKAMSVWNSWDSAKTIGENMAVTASNITTATSAFFKAHAWIPYVGAALAIGFIAMMMSSMKSTGYNGSSNGASEAATPYSDRGSGLQFTGRAVGGLISRPEYTLMGENGPEVIAPESSFKDYSLDLMRNSINELRYFVTGNESLLSGFYGANYKSGQANIPSLANDAVSLTITGGVYGSDAEKEIYKMLQNYQRKNG